MTREKTSPEQHHPNNLSSTSPKANVISTSSKQHHFDITPKTSFRPKARRAEVEKSLYSPEAATIFHSQDPPPTPCCSRTGAIMLLPIENPPLFLNFRLLLESLQEDICWSAPAPCQVPFANKPRRINNLQLPNRYRSVAILVSVHKSVKFSGNLGDDLSFQELADNIQHFQEHAIEVRA